jgi:Transcription factor S-II (TFIIS)
MAAASDFLSAVAVGTSETMKKEVFADGVFCDREQWAGGDMHRRLLWWQCISAFRLRGDCPPELRAADPHRLTLAALNFSEHGTVPSEEALLRAFEAMREHQQRLLRRAEEREGTEQEVRERRLSRRRQVRARADAQRAEERSRGPSEERYQHAINAASRALHLKLANLRPRILLEFRVALAFCKKDRETGLRRSYEHFQGGTERLVELVSEMLENKTTSLSEYTMAHWKVICDKAMSKWRPYAKKSAAAVGLSEIRHLAAGTSLYRPVDGSRTVVAPVDVLGGRHGVAAMTDVKSRLRRISEDDEEAGKLFSFCLARVKEMQSFRAELVSASRLPWVRKEPELALLVAAGEQGFSPSKHREHGISKARDYVELATMSPLGLLQLVTSFVCTSPEGAHFWPGLLAWREASLRKATEEEAGGDEKAALLKLLSVISRCPRCGSEKTTQEWRKTRSADEPFQFLICCVSCKAATVVE